MPYSEPGDIDRFYYFQKFSSNFWFECELIETETSGF